MPIDKFKKMAHWSASQRRGPKSKQVWRIKLVSILATFMLAGVIFGSVFALAAVAYVARDLPSPDRLTEREVPQSTKIFSRQGDLLYEIFADQRRTLISLEDVPQDLIDATLAVEDADFYRHQGFDARGILRAALVIVRGEGFQGGSTITQQLVKNTLLTPERTLSRKVRDIILAIELERRYSKNEILQMYLNEAPYGGQAWGVGAAAEMYFGKHVRDIGLAEAAFLAGLPQSPTRYSPYAGEEGAAAGRQSYVLHLMQERGWVGADNQRRYLSVEQTQEAREEFRQISFRPNINNIQAPHFVMYVKARLAEEFGERTVGEGGLRVYTTLDMNLQRIAEEEVEKQLEQLKNYNATNAGLVVVNSRTGEILAMVGSRDYFDQEHDGSVNVTLSARQPGSSIKPIMYVTALSQGYTPAAFLSDIRTCFPGGAGQPDYCPVNWDDKYWGPLLLREALANSRNVPAVKMLAQVGLPSVIDMAHQLGITTLNEPERYGLSLTLGGGEVKPIDMAKAFAVFANQGVQHDLVSIKKVEDSAGKVIREFKPEKVKGKKVLDEKYAYLVSHILSDAAARAPTFGSAFEIGRPLAVKTGTTNDNRDAWTVGYTPQLVGVVWVGNFNNEPMKGIQGSTGATPIFRNFMRRALQGKEAEQFKRPEGVVEVEVEKLSGKIPQESKEYAKKTELFAKGTEPTQIDDFHVSLEVCKDKGLIATQWHKDNSQSEKKTFVYLREPSEAWQSYTDEWMQAHADEGYGVPPEEKCPIEINGQVQESPVIQFEYPEDGAKFAQVQKEFEVRVKAYSANTITRVELFLSGEKQGETAAAPYKFELKLEGNLFGEQELRARAYDSKGNAGENSIKIFYPEAPGPSPSPTP